MAKDQNRVPGITGVSNADGLTAIPIYADPVTHALTYSVSNGTMPITNTAEKDGDRDATALGTSNSDGTPVAIGADATDKGIFLQSA